MQTDRIMEQSPFAKLDPAALLSEAKAEAARIEDRAKQLQTEVEETFARRDRVRLLRFVRTLREAPRAMEALLQEQRQRLGGSHVPDRSDEGTSASEPLRTSPRRIGLAAGEVRAVLENIKPEDMEHGEALSLLLRLKDEAAGLKELLHLFQKGAPRDFRPLTTAIVEFFASLTEFEVQIDRNEALLSQIRGAVDDAIGSLVGEDGVERAPVDLEPLIERVRQAGVDLKFVAHDLRKSLKLAELSQSFEVAQQRSRIRTLCLAEIFPGIDKVSLPVGAVNEFGGHPNKVDLLFVSAMAKYRGARNIFEFGTYTGRTTYHLTLASEAARVTTLNLPPELETRLAPYLMTYYRGSDRADRITQKFEDSRKFDPTPFAGQYDFIFVDADHSYELVKIDTEKALTMLAPKGMLVWHDYAPKSPGVVQFMEEFSQQRAIFHIRNTCLTLWIDGVDAEAFDPAPMPPSAEYDAITERERALRAAQ
jgi:predicted O-methyltransferase YrrM